MSIASYYPSLLAVFGASLIAFASPGPNFVGIASSAVYSRVNGVFVAIGVSIGTAFWAIMAVSGMTALVSHYSSATLVMQIMGGSYLLWLGFKSLLSAVNTNSPLSVKESVGETRQHSFRKGLFIQLTNPKPALFWLAMVSTVIAKDSPLLVGVILVVGVTAIAFAWHLLLAFVFSIYHARTYYLKARQGIALLFGLLFIAFGGRLILWNIAGI